MILILLAGALLLFAGFDKLPASAEPYAYSLLGALFVTLYCLSPRGDDD